MGDRSVHDQTVLSNYSTMRLPLGRNFHPLVALFIVVALYISFRDGYLSPSPPGPVGGKARAATAGQTHTTTPSANLNSTEDVVRIKSVVDSIPEMSLPSQLKFGFEMLTSERSKEPMLPSMEPAVAESLFYNYIEAMQITCPQKTRIGTAEDGGWDACITGPFNISAPCLVYSIGMGGEWSFDHMITDTYKCLDMAYDPTLCKKDYKPKELLWFYSTGLGFSDMVNSNEWKLRTLETLLEENGHDNRTVDILKIDVEYSEWESLEAILRDGSLRNVKQLMVEFHTMEVHEGRNSTTLNFSYYWHILRGLDKLGFKSWHYLETPSGHYTSVHTGKEMPCCANVYFVNAALLI